MLLDERVWPTLTHHFDICCVTGRGQSLTFIYPLGSKSSWRGAILDISSAQQDQLKARMGNLEASSRGAKWTEIKLMICDEGRAISQTLCSFAKAGSPVP